MNNTTKNKKDKVCSANGCERPSFAKSYCTMHYQRWSKHGNPHVTKRLTKKKCTVAGCEKPHNAKGYCVKHYERWKKYGDPNKYKYKYEVEYGKGKCQVDGCEENHFSKNYCKRHHVQFNREQYNSYWHKREARKRQAPINDFDEKDWQECLRIFNYSCAYCAVSTDDLHKEHVVPLSRQGSHTKSNIVPSCPSCNSSKHQRTMVKWYPEQSFYDRKREEKILKWMGYKIDDNKVQMRLF